VCKCVCVFLDFNGVCVCMCVCMYVCMIILFIYIEITVQTLCTQWFLTLFSSQFPMDVRIQHTHTRTQAHTFDTHTRIYYIFDIYKHRHTYTHIPVHMYLSHVCSGYISPLFLSLSLSHTQHTHTYTRTHTHTHRWY